MKPLHLKGQANSQRNERNRPPETAIQLPQPIRTSPKALTIQKPPGNDFLQEPEHTERSVPGEIHHANHEKNPSRASSN
jgi:hypothetical protein